MASRAMRPQDRQVDKDGASLDSEALGTLLSKISAEIGELGHHISTGAMVSYPSIRPASEALSSVSQRNLARGILRRQRDALFPKGLFGEAAWDMLLDLFVAKTEGRKIAVSSACIASAVPSTTALRWLRTLMERKMVQRQADPTDGRRVWVELTPHTEELLRAVLTEL